MGVSAPCTSGTSYDAGGYPGWGDSNKCSDCQQPLALVALGQFLARPANMRRSRLEVEQGSNRKGGVRGIHCARFPPRCNGMTPTFFSRKFLFTKVSRVPFHHNLGAMSVANAPAFWINASYRLGFQLHEEPSTTWRGTSARVPNV